MRAMNAVRSRELRSMGSSAHRSCSTVPLHQGLPGQRTRRGRGYRRRGVVAPWMKRVALTQAHDRKQATPKRAVALEASDGVAGARGLEPADVAEQRRKQP